MHLGTDSLINRLLRNKALTLGIGLVASFVLALAIDYVCYLFVGPTSMGVWYNPYWIGFFFVCASILCAFFVFRKDIKTKPENLFLVIVLSITCFSSVAFYLNDVSWDVGHHYRYALEWSSPDRITELSVADSRKIYNIDNEGLLTVKGLHDYAEELNGEDAIKTGEEHWVSLRILYNRVAALPGSLVLMVCTALSVPFALKYVLTRLIYALIYSFVTYLGMRQLKSGKMLYAVVALLPTAVFIAANYSYDYWVNAFVLLAVALVVRELQTPGQLISKRRILLILACFFVGFAPKAIYFPLVLLCLLIPRSKFSSVLGSRLFRGGVVAVCLLVVASFAIPYFVVSGPGVGDLRGGSDVNSTEQIGFILAHPFEYARILVGFLFHYFSIAASRDYLGFYAYLGYSSWPLWILVYILLIFTALTDKSKVDKTVGTWKSRTVVLVICLITVVLIATSLYVSFTPVRYETINGCQPRYLIPVLFCTLVFLGSHKLAWPRVQDRRKTIYNALVLGLMPLAYMVGLWQVYVGLIS